MKRKVSDYIVDYLIQQGIKDVFGYPGGMVTHLMDSLKKKEGAITSHLMYHEQALAFAGCSYAQITGKPTVVYATSGPGATNLVTGIANAYYDSIPVIFLTGQVNTSEHNDLGLRQRGFQETDIVSMVQGITKSAVRITDPKDIKKYLDEAFFLAQHGRPGPVLLDIPMNISKAIVDENELVAHEQKKDNEEVDFGPLDALLGSAKRPVMILGAGAKFSAEPPLLKFAEKNSIPIVTSMLAFDLGNLVHSYGFIGAYGSRAANFIVAKSDLILSLGARLDVRQVGGKRNEFAPNATIVRVDVDPKELGYKIREKELDLRISAASFLAHLLTLSLPNYEEWNNVCKTIQDKLKGIDPVPIQKQIFDLLNKRIPEGAIITTDVGQNQVWTAQYSNVKNAKVLFSGGHAAMGYSLPAAIGAAYAKPSSPIISINGDGGIQMNIQEFQTIARDHLPIKVIILNNSSLGMIRHFQEMYFDSHFAYTTPEDSFVNPPFTKIAEAYGIESVLIKDIRDIASLDLTSKKPMVIEIVIDAPTYVVPKLEFGKPNQDQEPLLDRKLYQELMDL